MSESTYAKTRYLRKQSSQKQSSDPTSERTTEVIVVKSHYSIFWIILICLIASLILSIILTALFNEQTWPFGLILISVIIIVIIILIVYSSRNKRVYYVN